ncbi:hypothetical protein AAXE64_27150 [Priestia megaterium]
MQELTEIKKEYATTELNDAELIVISKQHFDDLVNSNEYFIIHVKDVRRRSKSLSERVSELSNEVQLLKKEKNKK